jgi:hypothetical protein
MYKNSCCQNYDKFIPAKIFTKWLTISTSQNIESKSLLKKAKLWCIGIEIF